MNTAPARREGGFTLVELVVVLAIVAIGAAIAAPSLVDSLRMQRARAATSDLTSALLLARAALPPISVLTPAWLLAGRAAIKRRAKVRIARQWGPDWTGGGRVGGVTSGDQLARRDGLGEGVQGAGPPATVVYERTGRL